MAKGLIAEYMAKRDPFLAWLQARRQLSPWRLAGITIVIVVIVDGLTICIQGTPISTPTTPALYRTWHEFFGGLSRDLVLAPTIMGFYLWIPLGLDKVFDSLRSSNVLGMTEKEYKSMISDDISTICADKRWTYIAAVLTPVGLVLWYLFWAGYLGPLEPTWLTGVRGHAVFCVRSAIWMICGYAGLMVVVNETIVVRVLRKVFREHAIQLRPFHPDRCGGLKSTGDHALTISYLIGLAGFSIFIAAFLSREVGRIHYGDYPLYASIVVYLILSPTLFFLPLVMVHNAMKAAKESLLLAILNQLETAYLQAQADLPSTAAELKNTVERIEHLRALYSLTERFAEWPFDTSIIRRLIVSIPTPVLSSIAISFLVKLAIEMLSV